MKLAVLVGVLAVAGFGRAQAGQVCRCVAWNLRGQCIEVRCESDDVFRPTADLPPGRRPLKIFQ